MIASAICISQQLSQELQGTAKDQQDLVGKNKILELFFY